ncbi:MAG: TolC family protein [Bacteroides sp.]|nr:TolC family protein [Bacteroides sp.]
MNVAIADAAIVQARLLENPELSLSEVNLWSTRSGRREAAIPPLFGSFGKNTEFSVELSQLIQTANKRGKLVRMEKVSREIALAEFEETLRGLKAELHHTIDEMLYIQDYREVVSGQIRSLTHLTQAYTRQVEQGNLAKSELLRLQYALFEAENEWIEVETSWNALQKRDAYIAEFLSRCCHYYYRRG